MEAGIEEKLERPRAATVPLDAVMLCVTDAGGRFLAVNSVWEAVLGWRREELTATPFLDFVHPEDHERTRQVMGRLSASEYVLTDFYNRYRTVAGDWRWLQWSTWSDGVTWLAFAVDVTESLEQERFLSEALDADRIVPYVQPIVDAASREVVHLEVLARLDPGDGSPPLAPDRFLPLAERTGMIREIDRRMTDHALMLAERGHEVSVNLSGRSIGHEGFTAELLELLARVDPEIVSRLVFEVTESALVIDDEPAKEFACTVRKVGAQIAIDDFGTGYGTIRYLRELPVSYLKVDKSMLRALRESPADQALIQSIIVMARSLGKKTIAEGVEDEETLELLCDWGVDRVQGYLLGRPAPSPA